MQGGYGAVFAIQVQSLMSITRVAIQIILRPEICQGAEMLFEGTGAVSRYKLSRSQKTVTVQDLFCEQVSVSGCKSQYKFVLRVGAKQKL